MEELLTLWCDDSDNRLAIVKSKGSLGAVLKKSGSQVGDFLELATFKEEDGRVFDLIRNINSRRRYRSNSGIHNEAIEQIMEHLCKERDPSDRNRIQCMASFVVKEIFDGSSMGSLIDDSLARVYWYHFDDPDFIRTQRK